MTLLNIAKIAGVSMSTVSRVVNNQPRVAPETAQAVREIIQQTKFEPRRSRGRSRARPASRDAATIAFLVFGSPGYRAAPAVEDLLHGISAASNDQNLDIIFAFVSDPSTLPPKLQQRVDGLLLHGDQPAPGLQARLQKLPTVWLMANRQRPAWGDQVMPDHTVAGELAARYLVRHGHRRLAILNVAPSAWDTDLRAMSFTRVAQDLGAEVSSLHGPASVSGERTESENLPQLAERIVDRLLKLAPRPTGLFIMEDRQVVAIDAALRRRGMTPGVKRDVTIISCNNERPHLLNLNPVPATIDIRAESIGRRGVELLLTRLRNVNIREGERIRTMVEPLLVESEDEAKPR